MSTPQARATPPEPTEYAPYYARYTGLVPAGDIAAVLETQGAALGALLGAAPPGVADLRYAAAKWSVAEVLGHISDAERVFAYRALRFARGDGTPLATFDENAWAASDGVAGRALPDLVAEFAAVRAASVALLRGLPDAAWQRDGVASGHRCTVRALAWIIAGHALHHEALLRTRYLVVTEA